MEGRVEEDRKGAKGVCGNQFSTFQGCNALRSVRLLPSTDRQTDKQTHRHTDTQSYRQTDKHTNTHSA